MTNERQHPDSAAETDKVVSDTYRQLSRESAPDHLNEKVLQQAASVAARPRYSRSIMWTQPLAWAATIALCLAIVLEVTRVPTPEIVDIPEPLDTLGVEPASTLEPEPVELKTQSPVQALTKQQPSALADKKSQIGRAAAKQVAPDNVAEKPRRELRSLDVAQDAEVDPGTAEEEVALGLDEYMRDADMQPQSYDMARQKTASNEQHALKETAAFAMPALLAVNECADEVRADPVTWLACIADFEESGDAEAALREREALKEAFPQFEMP